MGLIIQYLRQYSSLFLLGIFCLSIEAICDLAQPTIMAKIVDVGVRNNSILYVEKMSLYMIGVTALGAFAAVSRNYLATVVSQRISAKIRSDIYKKIHSFSFENIDNFEASSLVTRLTNDVNQIQNFINGIMRVFVKAPLICLGSIVMTTLLNPKMSLLLAIIIPIIAVLIFANTKIGFPFFKKVQSSIDNMNGIIREYLTGVRVVKAFKRFDYEMERFSNSNNTLAYLTTKAMRVMSLFNPLITFIVNIGIIAVLWLGASWVNLGTMQVGQVIAFTNYMSQILMSLVLISYVFNIFVRAKTSAERIVEVLHTSNTINDLIDADLVCDKSLEIAFNNVSFSYPKSSGEAVLKDVSCSFSSGESIGIIGSTGAGKTSLINLIPRFYDINSGQITVGGENLNQLDIMDFRNKISLVPQKTTLFTGSIAENIRFGKEDTSQLEIENAAKISMIHEFIISLPEGYNTLLGRGGINLSGGQKQRISIARALVRKPKILILDDATSAVDVITEKNIREEIRRFSKDLTSIIIAQRISSVIALDKILVIDTGSIVGIGKHDELIKNCRIYQDIYISQFGKENL